jgi:hypothetical protein
MPGEDGGDVPSGHAVQMQVYLLRPGWRGKRGRTSLRRWERLSGPRLSVEREHGPGEFWPGAGRAQRYAAPPPREQAHQASGTYPHDNRRDDQQHLDQPGDSGPPGLCRANAHAARFVLTARTQATDRMLIFGERHPRKALAEYARHRNKRGPHRSRHLHPPRPNHPAAGLSRERIKRQPIPRGLINQYEQAT